MKRRVLFLVPSLKSTRLDDEHRQIFSWDSDQMTLKEYSHLLKQSLTYISGHPVRPFKQISYPTHISLSNSTLLTIVKMIITFVHY